MHYADIPTYMQKYITYLEGLVLSQRKLVALYKRYDHFCREVSDSPWNADGRHTGLGSKCKFIHGPWKYWTGKCQVGSNAGAVVSYA